MTTPACHDLDQSWTTQVNPALAMYDCCLDDMYQGLCFSVVANGEGPGTCGDAVVYTPCPVAFSAGSSVQAEVLIPESVMSGSTDMQAVNS